MQGNLNQISINMLHVQLMSVAMKCFERPDMAHINTIFPETLDTLNFEYRPNTISIALNNDLSHLDNRNTYTTGQKF